MTATRTVAATGTVTATGWTGTWVAEQLGVTLTTHDSAVGIDLHDLVGLALRRNPRRAHLLVSTVLGKHVPTDPRVVHAAGLLLGLLASDVLTGGTTVTAADGLSTLLSAAIRNDPGAAERLLLTVDTLHDMTATTPAGTVVVGYAETATALGHAVAAALAVPCLHSTRRPVAGLAPAAGFAEEHSHATEHLLLPSDPHFLADAETVVLVDDEVSTGRTVLNTVRALHGVRPRGRYVVASLVDLRSVEDRALFTELEHELDTRIDVVALAEGTISLPDDVLLRAERLVAALLEPVEETPAPSRGTVARRFAWPVGPRDGARHGFGPEDERVLHDRTARVAAELARDLDGDGDVLVLGFEELMYTPLLIGLGLARVTGRTVRYSTTTRSPVLAVDDPGYAIRTTVTFPAHDDPADGPGPRFAHNVAPGTDPARRFDHVVLVIDSAADTTELAEPGGLLDTLAGCCDRVHLVVVPTFRPEESP